LIRIHPRYGTPFWSVTTVTATIVAMIVFFIALFPAEGAPLGIDLGLTALTGFATLNLLLPLAVVNAALIVHRRKFPDIERGFRVPGVPVVPILGILANLALILNLPFKGIITGLTLVVLLVLSYLAWGGAPEVDELLREVVPADGVGPKPPSGGGSEVPATPPSEPAGGGESETGRFRVLVSIARPERARSYVRLAAALARGRGRDPFVQVLNVTELPDQTPHEMVSDTAQRRADRIAANLAEADIDVEYSFEAHTSRDVAFDVVQTARNNEADLVLMGYPEEHPGLTQAVEYKAPCDVVFASGFEDDVQVDRVTVGAGGGPHHRGSLSMVRALAEQGADVCIVSVTPRRSGSTEDPGETVSAFEGLDVEVRSVAADTVAEGLVDVATADGGVLVIGASRDRRLRQWIFGSTPDNVVERATEERIPVLVYAKASGVPQRVEDYAFPVYRYLRRRIHGDDTYRLRD
jgi:nucleotide-binding universal stress UspA family protein